MRKLIIILGFVLLMNTGQAQLKTKSISVFKNGQSFVVKEGTISTNEKMFALDEIPPALFGTLWFTSPNDDITQVVSKQVNAKRTRNALSMSELLRANKGKVVTIELAERIMTGVIVDMEAQHESYLMFKSDDEWLTIHPSSIRSIAFAEEPDTQVNDVDSLTANIQVHFKDEGEKQVELIYLQEGISWTPTYLLELISDTEARINLQAEVINQLENLDGIDMHFVVGVPNFQFANRPATLAHLPNYMLPHPAMPYSNYNVAQTFSNTMTYADFEYEEEISARDFGYNVEAPNVSDAQSNLYFYTLKNIRLDRGGSAHYPVFNTKVKIKHFYEAVLPSSDVSAYRYQQAGYSFNEKRSEVFHTIEIQNNTELPFTTGAIMMIDNQSRRPLAQSRLNYTPAGQDGFVQVTKAPDIAVNEQENLKSMNESKNHLFNNTDYKEVVLENEITVINTKSEAINFILRKSIDGELIDANEKFESNTVIIPNQVNPKQSLRFEIKLEAGEKRVIKYQYNAWIRK